MRRARQVAARYAEGTPSAGSDEISLGYQKGRQCVFGDCEMKLVEVPVEDLHLSPELVRSCRAKSFEERLRSSIDEVGLAEPLKIAQRPPGGFLVIDGALRLRAIRAIREQDSSR